MALGSAVPLLIGVVVDPSAVDRTAAALATYAGDLLLSLLVLVPWFWLGRRRWKRPRDGRAWKTVVLLTLAVEAGIVVFGAGDGQELRVALAGTLPLALLKVTALASVAGRRTGASR